MVADHGTSQPAVLFPVEPVALRDLAQQDGLGFTDVLTLAEVPSTTLNRMWKDPDWAARSTGGALHQLLDVVPTLSPYLEGRGFTLRLGRYLRVFAAAGITIRLPQRIDGTQLAALSNALGVLAAVAEGHTTEVMRRLALGWGLGHDRFIDAVFATGPDGLCGEDGVVLGTASKMWRTAAHSTSVSNMVGKGVLAHKITKYGVAEVDYSPPIREIRDMHSAFVHRSLRIGAMFRDDDLDEVWRYQREVEDNVVLARNESWSLLTFGRGRRLPVDFSLPTPTPRVYEEVLRDVVTCNDAYLGYLSTAALPALWSVQPPPAPLRLRLSKALENRLSSGIIDQQLRSEVGSLHRRLQQ
ncbi:hypothetical protein ACFWPX_33275 [Nocardia sp. NPDC058518]|uniref:hypothetical protein n=1 Tax=Nocardia sp. NPDC058518 TaxID=3346534 RepID=UPI00365AF9FF